MNRTTRQNGFSLTETLLAVGTLAIGLVFIAGTFLTGVYFSTVSTERTIAAVASDEAFAKVRLYGLDPNSTGLKTGEFVPYEQIAIIPPQEFLYPSVPGETGQQYSWAVVCRRVGSGSRLVQCVVFVCRETNPNSRYWRRTSGAAWPQLEQYDLPRPLRVTIVRDAATHAADEVSIKDAVPTDAVDELAFVNDGSMLVDDKTGEIYRVLERYPNQPDRLKLDRPWAGVLPSLTGGWAWVVPSAVAGGRNPLIGVYQQVFSLSK